MSSNFQFLKSNKHFRSFAAACMEAEKSLLVSPATCAILSRRALELAVKWVYQIDSDLTVPYDDRLDTLIHDPTFKSIVAEDMVPLLNYVKKQGNVAVHTNSPVTRDEAILSLQHLHQFVSWVDYCYSDEASAGDFEEAILPQGEEKRTRPKELQDLYERLSSKDRRLQEMVDENKQLRLQLTQKRQRNTEEQAFYVEVPSEYQTRKMYIDVELKLAGWDFREQIAVEMPIEGMPTAGGTGYADYVLFGADGNPLAVIEAKRTTVDAKQGQQQAKLYADCLEQMYGQRPLIFYTNGYERYLWDDLAYPPRKVAGFYTREECSSLIRRRTMQKPLENIEIKDEITNRYYQKEAILRVCEDFSKKQRKALLVMATGSGKTRTAISIVDVLTRHSWVKNVLFLADRKALLTQAKNNFNHLLPDLTLCNLLEEKEKSEESRVIFSTYKTMMNAIDETRQKNGQRLFTVGYFDLIIIDESHRSIYKKYREIFEYFDGMLLGLTATPKDEVDINTYNVFDLESGVPTYAYELWEAVRDGYLVDYRTVETKLKFLEQGIRYDQLSEEERELYEETFDGEKESEDIDSSALNEWLFNDHTIDQVLHNLVEKGEKIAGGDKLGKTIIFAKNHHHAERIVERFNILYPQYGGDFTRVIDYKVNYHQALYADFHDRQKLPQVAISVDMLDTGVDIPDVVNLVFFKKVRSKSKFWQMIGRGTRLCEDLYGLGEDKSHFIIFDYCRNFDFFRENPKGFERKMVKSLTERLFHTQVDLARELQALEYQEEPMTSFRQERVKEACAQIMTLDEEHFRVRQQLRYVHKFKDSSNWVALTAKDVQELKEHVSPLLNPLDDEDLAKRFDLLLYNIQLAQILKKKAGKPIGSVMQTAEGLSKLGTIPQVTAKKQTILKAMNESFWQEAGLLELEQVRSDLRELIKFLERKTQKIYYTNFTDEVMEVRENPSLYHVNGLKNYRKKVHHYLFENQELTVIQKLKNNKPLSFQDVQELERVLWTELGTKDDYKKEFGDTPVTKLARQIVGLDQQAANEAFSEFLSSERLSFEQSQYVKLVIHYIVKNGIMDKKVLQEDPFKAVGSIVEVFKDSEEDAKRIVHIIDQINQNCEHVVGL